MKSRTLVLAIVLLLPTTPSPVHAQSTVTFYKDVLPILQKNCQSCHRPGHIAPMSLLTYGDVRPWAKAIKSALLTRKSHRGSPIHSMATSRTIVL